MTVKITIRPEREKPVINQHPWIFSGAIEKIDGTPAPGDIVTIVNSKGKFLARGYFNEKSQIHVRILTWKDEPINDDWWRNALERAVTSRKISPEITNAYRIVNAENDFLPGLTVDLYDKWAVMQIGTLGIEVRKQLLTEMLADILSPAGIYERSDLDIRGRDGLNSVVGHLWGEEPPDTVSITEHGLKYEVDLRKGHKTGFYLDQRDNRNLLRDLINTDLADRKDDLHVLNLFSYTGGFGLNALNAGITSLANVDASREVLELAEANVEANNPAWLEQSEFIQADAFDFLREEREQEAQYDLIICDPPKFAQNTKQVEAATRGYKDLNLNSFHLIRPGGYLMTYSCSGAITQDLFQKVVFGALADSKRQAQIVRHLGPGTDHPVALTFPEGAYLKGLLLKVY